MLTLKKPLEFTGEIVIFDVGMTEGVHPQPVDSSDKKGDPFEPPLIIILITKKSVLLSQATHLIPPLYHFSIAFNSALSRLASSPLKVLALARK